MAKVEDGIKFANLLIKIGSLCWIISVSSIITRVYKHGRVTKNLKMPK